MTGRVALVAALVVLVPRVVAACPVCFGAADGPMLRGSSMGILALLVVTLGMFAAFGAFFLHLARKAAKPDVPSAAGSWEQGGVR